MLTGWLRGAKILNGHSPASPATALLNFLIETPPTLLSYLSASPGGPYDSAPCNLDDVLQRQFNQIQAGWDPGLSCLHRVVYTVLRALKPYGGGRGGKRWCYWLVLLTRLLRPWP